MSHFSQSRTSFLAALSAASTIFAACSSEYTSCEATRTCDPTGDPEGGAPSGEGGRGATGGVGGDATAGDSNVGGDAGAAGSDGTGVAGSDAGGMGPSGGAPGGEGGATSSGGAPASGGGPGSESGGSAGSDGTSGGVSGAAGSAGAGGEGGSSGPRCGDAIVDAGEACDDGNDDPADGCRTNCTWGPKEVIAGRASSCAIYGNGSAKCWGYNNYGVLGQRDEVERGSLPGQLGAKLPFIKIGNTVGKFTSLALMQDMACGVVKQQVWCWGRDEWGELGQGTNTLSAALTPAVVDLGGPVKSVSVGGQFACALLVDGSVKCWGNGTLGRLGVGSTDDFGDEPGEMGSAGAKPTAVPLGGEKAVQVVAGWDRACAVRASYGVTCWGSNLNGALGMEAKFTAYGDIPGQIPVAAMIPTPTPTKPPALGLGRAHACTTQDDILRCWGSNVSGALGLGITTGALGDEPGEMTSLGIVPVSVPLASDPVVSVHGGYDTTCALMASGSVKCWGNAGVDGHLGQPRFIGTMGNIGDAPEELSVLPPIDFGAGVTVRSLATGLGSRDSATGNAYVHSCVLLSTGDVKCWGSNGSGQLGLGHTNPVGLVTSDLGANMKAVPLD